MNKELEELQKREQFIDLAKEVYPLMQKIRDLMQEHGFGSDASIIIRESGYMEFDPYNTDWKMTRYAKEETPIVRYDFQEAITLGEAEK